MATTSGNISQEQKYVFENARKLCEIDAQYDPETEPYKSKYKARSLLCDLYSELLEKRDAEVSERSSEGENLHLRTSVNDSTDSITSRQEPSVLTTAVAALDCYIGVNLIETEEISAGDDRLKKCLESLDGYELSSNAALIAIEALNQRGIVCAGRSNQEEALNVLNKSEQIYKNYKHAIGGCPKMPYEFLEIELDVEGSHRTIEKKRCDHFEDAHTHTLYFIAQVYSNMKEDEKSALYCHETLRRQLKSYKYNAVDWSMNAATLSQYYMVNDNFDMARHCLASASVVLTEEGNPNTIVPPEVEQTEEGKDYEKLPRAWANLYRCFVKYGLTLLEKSRDKLLAEVENMDAPESDSSKTDHNADKNPTSNIPDSATSATANAMGNDEANQQKRDLYFDLELTRTEDKITANYILTFDEARKVFLCVQGWLKDALKYFTIDEHCSDYIEVIQDYSSLYKYLTFFEMDMQRQCQMHKKRIDLLMALNKELNPQYFLMINRQLTYEIAETYSAMLDLKLAKIEESSEPPNAHSRKKINLLTENSIKQYMAYLDTIKGQEKELPDRLSEDDERAVMVAWFCVGRLHSKFLEFEVEKRLNNITRSLQFYKKLVLYCDTYKEAKEKMKEEYEICAEMIELLPAKMQRIAARAM